MINAVYQLIAPRMIDTTYKEIELTENSVVIRPVFMSICKADQRYYQGQRSQSVLKAKLPMALIHECVAQVIFDPTGTFNKGDYVVPIPNTPTKSDDVIAENYLKSSYFRSSGYDGYFQDYVVTTPERLVKKAQAMSMQVASFTELISVSVHAVSRFEKSAHKRKEKIGIWGDGNVGFITALVLSYYYPDAQLYVLGTVDEKLSYFTFAKDVYLVDNVPDDFEIDHAFECVGGAGATSAINQIIDHINPEGTISLLGVSENFVDINTRMILEKGLRLSGSSRSGREDFDKTMSLINDNPDMNHYLEHLVGDVIDIKSISDIHKAFDIDLSKSFGKTILKWDK